MGLFDFLKKKKDTNDTPSSTRLPTPPPIHNYDSIRPTETHFTIELNKSDLERLIKGNPNKTDFTHLDEDGELPFGWVVYNQNIVSQIEKELSAIRNPIQTTSNVRSEYAALKSYFLYLIDGQKHYSKIGECEGKYFEEYIVNSQESSDKWKRFKYIEEHYDELLKQEKVKRDIEQNLLPHLRTDLLKIIRDNPGILQTDIYKKFDSPAKEYVSSELYFMAKDGIIKREKAGRTYSLKSIF